MESVKSVVFHLSFSFLSLHYKGALATQGKIIISWLTLYPFKLFFGRFAIVYGLPSGQGFDETCQY